MAGPWEQYRQAETGPWTTYQAGGAGSSAARRPVILDLDGRRVEVDESFLSLPPDAQNRTVDEIASSIGSRAQNDLSLDQKKALAMAAARARAAGASPPPGFLLDQPQSASSLPPGFVLDRQSQSQPNPTPAVPQRMIPVFDMNGAATGYEEPALAPSQMPYGEQIGNAAGFIGRTADKGARLFADGVTLGTGDKVAATLRGALPGGDYDAALAGERAYTRQAAEDAGPVASATLRGAGNVSGLVAAQGAGLPVFGLPGAGLVGRTASAAGTMGAIGAGAGAINADGGVNEKTANALLEGGIHAGAGAAGPLIGAGVGAVARPVMSWLRPEQSAVQRVAEALKDSGRSATEVAAGMRTAAMEGQPQFTVADSIGNAGGRLLAGVAKQPGPGREFAKEFLDQRQAGQARRLTNFIEEGFQAPETAAQATARLTARRAEEGAANYAAARQDAGAVDVTGALAAIDRTVSPGASRAFSSTSNIADDSVEAALRKARSLLAYEGPAAAPAQGAQPGGWGAYNRGSERVMDFQATHRAMLDIGDMADAAARAGRNNQARLLGEVRRELDMALTKASPSYAAARDSYAAGSRQIEAIETGANAAQRGRSEDVLRTFGALSPEEQAAFRHGYADRYVQAAQGGAAGVNAARPLTSDTVRSEFPAIAGAERGDRLMRQIDRENTMFATRNSATGGSATAENLADMKGGISGIAELLMQGRPMAAGGVALGRTLNALAGNGSKKGREEVTRVLLSVDPNTVARIAERGGGHLSEGVRQVARALMQAGLTGAADRALPASAR